MKITDLTESNCIKCDSIEEVDRIYDIMPRAKWNFRESFYSYNNQCILYLDGDMSSISRAKNHNYNIIPSTQIT